MKLIAEKCKSSEDSELHNDASFWLFKSHLFSQLPQFSKFQTAVCSRTSLMKSSRSCSEWKWPIRFKLKSADMGQIENGRSASKWKWPIRFKMKLADLVQRKNGRSGSKSKWPTWFKMKMTDLVQNDRSGPNDRWSLNSRFSPNDRFLKMIDLVQAWALLINFSE